MRKNKFLAALAIAACLATSVPLSASAATLGQAASASEVTYGKVSVADQAKIKEVFVAADYAELNPDLVAAGLTGDALFNHFITAGLFEGRQANKNFNVAVYRSAYADLQKEFGNDLVKYYVHYAAFGKAEGRKLTTVEAAKANGVEVKSLFSDKVILDKVAAPAASTSSSNSGSTTPAKEKTEEELAAEKEAAEKAAQEAEAKKNEELAQRDTTIIPANNGKGEYKAFANPKKVATAILSTSSTISKQFEETLLKPNVEYDYKSGKFYDTNDADGAVLGTRVLDGGDVVGKFIEVNGKYYKLEDVVTVRDTLTTDMKTVGVVWAGYANEAIDNMLIRGLYANNTNKGFFNAKLGKVTPEEAEASGLNPSLWEKGDDGYWYPVVANEADAYKKSDLVDAHNNPEGWNYKTSESGEIQWHYTGANGNDDDDVAVEWKVEKMFVRRGVTSVSTFNVQEKGYTRKVTEDAPQAALYETSYLASNGFRTVSEAGKDGYKGTKVSGANAVSFYEALTFGILGADDILTQKDGNGVDAGKVNNKYFEATPADGYFMDWSTSDWDGAKVLGANGLQNYLYTNDYKTACDFNSRDYRYLHGRLVENAPVNFTDKEIEEAVYCKNGYVKTATGYYKVIAEKATSNNNWLPSTYVYYKGQLCYDTNEDYKWEDASVYDALAIKEIKPGYIVVDLPLDGSEQDDEWKIFKEVTLSKLPGGGYNNEVFAVADDKLEKIKQFTANGRFYIFE